MLIFMLVPKQSMLSYSPSGTGSFNALKSFKVSSLKFISKNNSVNASGTCS